jgi:hypothetical protein
MPLTNAQHKTLRQDLIRDQLNKAQQGFEEILDGSHRADLPLLNALEIATDTHQGERLAQMLTRMHEARCAMWSALGMGNSATFR